MGRGVTIRNAGADEAVVLAELAARTFPLASPPSVSEEASAAFVAANLSAERFREYLMDPDRVVFVALEENVMVGYAMLVLGAPEDADVAEQLSIRPTCELSKLYLDAEWHGSGIAGALLRATLRAASSLGAQGIWLGTNQRNERAQRFYEKNGFARVGVKRFWVGDHHEDDYVYEQELEPSPPPDWVT